MILRLKISEISKLYIFQIRLMVHYIKLKSSKQKTNVFDYLLSDENVQKEAEKVLTNHLKRIGAYLSPNQKYEKTDSINSNHSKKASIIIPVNNRPDFICEAIESAQKQSFKILK